MTADTIDTSARNNTDPELTDEEVRNYLKSNSDFFQRHADMLDHLHISLNIKTCRAGKTTGGLISLLNRKGAWYCLGVFLVSGPSLA